MMGVGDEPLQRTGDDLLRGALCHQLPAARALLDILIEVAPQALEKTAVGKIPKRDTARVASDRIPASLNGSK